MGSGPGQDSRYLSGKDFRAVGLDGAWPLLLHARRRSPRLPLVRADLTSLPFRPRSFNAVWAAASLIHLTKRDLRALLIALGDIVAPGGALVATFAHGKGAGYLRKAGNAKDDG